jgi:N-acetylglucosaminyldiphosphoundecaprenol N-acetyl-beta-D-mannosaminyltransferase
MNYSGPFWLLGLPFDAIDMTGAVDRIHAAARERSRLLFVTPNVNFLALAAKDAAFRDTVLRSQLSLVDGMPLVWLGKSLGIPFTERVAGSSLLERLARDDRPLRVYFFGGPPDAARLASERLPELGSGLIPVGFHTPGFGNVESMSTTALIDSINGSGADFLVVALGAKKGHEWIAHNLERLRVPVISHLGASINFLAGTISRAPKWVQAAGLEWMWRIGQEPALFRRYRDDGIHFIPAALAAKRATANSRDRTAAELKLLPDGRNTGTWLLEGALTLATAGPLQQRFDSALACKESPAQLDVSGLVRVDAAGLGCLYTLQYRRPTRLEIVCTSPQVRTLFQAHHAEVLLGASVGP